MKKIRIAVTIEGVFEHKSKMVGDPLIAWVCDRIVSSVCGLVGSSSDHGSYQWIPDTEEHGRIIISATVKPNRRKGRKK